MLVELICTGMGAACTEAGLMLECGVSWRLGVGFPTLQSNSRVGSLTFP